MQKVLFGIEMNDEPQTGPSQNRTRPIGLATDTDTGL